MTQSVQRALRIMEALVANAPRAVLGDIAKATSLTPSTTYRILQTLVSEGYATAEEGGYYQPGSRILSLAGQMVTSMDYSTHARAGMLELQEHTPETIHFGVLSGEKAHYVDKLEGRRPYRLASVVGMSLQLHCTSIGKAILAHLPPGRVAALTEPERLVAHTRKTITDPARMAQELERIREQGFCIDDEEDRDEVRCIGAPVFDHHGQVFGALSVSAPTFQFTLQDAISLAPMLIDAARSTSAALGAPPEVSAAVGHPGLFGSD